MQWFDTGFARGYSGHAVLFVHLNLCKSGSERLLKGWQSAAAHTGRTNARLLGRSLIFTERTWNVIDKKSLLYLESHQTWNVNENK